jgi:hypothetical protein
MNPTAVIVTTEEYEEKEMEHMYLEYTHLQYNAFVEQVKKDGRIIIPIVKSRRTGKTVDGKTRERAAKELGLECPEIWMDFTSEEEEWEYEMMQQALRRNLTDMQWCHLVQQVLERRRMERHSKHGRQTDPENQLSTVYREFGQREETARKRFQRYDKLAKDPEQLRLVLQGKSYKEAMKDVSNLNLTKIQARIAERDKNPPKKKAYIKPYLDEVTQEVAYKELQEFASMRFPNETIRLRLRILKPNCPIKEGDKPA